MATTVASAVTHGVTLIRPPAVRQPLEILSLATALSAVILPPLNAQDRDRDTNRDRRRSVQVVQGDDRPRLGISLSSGSRRDTLGILVSGVTPGGAAAKAGLEEGDRIAAIDGVDLRLSAADAGEDDMDDLAQRRLIRELDKHKAGDEVELRVWSMGQFKTVKAKLTEPENLFQNLRTSLRQRRDDLENRAVLGVSLRPTGTRRDTLGVFVSSITSDGPADKAGIEEGDRIAAINGVDVRVAAPDAGDRAVSNARVRRLYRELEKVKPGDVVELRVYHSGQTKPVRVTTVKASELQGDGDGMFFFGDGLLPGIASPPEAPLPPTAPRFFQWNDDADLRLRLNPRLRSEFENGMEGLGRGWMELRRSLPRLRVEVDGDDGSGGTALARPAPRPRARTGDIAETSAPFASGGFGRTESAAGVWSTDDEAITIGGLKLAKVDGDLGSYLGAGADRGLLVLERSSRWPGVKEGDVVLSIDGRSVRHGDSISIALNGGRGHDVVVLRAGKTVTVHVPDEDR